MIPAMPGADPSNEFIGVDLDGTLAEYTTWRGVDHIGPPIAKMVARVQKWVLQENRNVVIFTARLSRDDHEAALEAIKAWCSEHLGFTLPATCVKHENMCEFWDDRCVQVKKNKGSRVGKQKVVTE